MIDLQRARRQRLYLQALTETIKVMIEHAAKANDHYSESRLMDDFLKIQRLNSKLVQGEEIWLSVVFCEANRLNQAS